MPFLHSDVIVASDQEDLLLTPGNRAEVLPGDEEEDEEGVLMMVMVMERMMVMMVMVMMVMMVMMAIMVIMGILVLTFLLHFYCNFIII